MTYLRLVRTKVYPAKMGDFTRQLGDSCLTAVTVQLSIYDPKIGMPPVSINKMMPYSCHGESIQ